MEGKEIIMGNAAFVEGTLAAGCRFFAGYPITPQNEIPERMSWRMPQEGGVMMQMEDELASIAAVIGASAAGTKACTSTSGPGFSLMQECVSWAAAIELPLVISDVQRTGPGSGIVSLPHHSDVMQAHYGGNGDYILPTYAPNSCQELFDFAIEAFNTSEIYRVPVVVLSDPWLGHLYEVLEYPTPEKLKEWVIPRKLPEGDPQSWIPFTRKDKKTGEFIITPVFQLGTKYMPWWVPSVSHNPMGLPIEGDTMMQDEVPSYAMVEAVNDKILKNEEKLVQTEEYKTDDADVVIVCYGLPARAAKRAVIDLREEGVKVGLLRFKTLWPFPAKKMTEIAQAVKKFVVPELNWGQLFIEIERYAAKEGAKAWLLKQISILHEPKEIVDKVKEVMAL
ncbi:MAG: 2-oxoacid:acceptor oxidoreductase subunit alpha [Candidatus Helarchaeota archaeon]|nr:2-oxoacid:acceptor oxidoreductase subunit alpha [Candidatus Helarchaeota archaeon]